MDIEQVMCQASIDRNDLFAMCLDVLGCKHFCKRDTRELHCRSDERTRDASTIVNRSIFPPGCCAVHITLRGPITALVPNRARSFDRGIAPRNGRLGLRSRLGRWYLPDVRSRSMAARHQLTFRRPLPFPICKYAYGRRETDLGKVWGICVTLSDMLSFGMSFRCYLRN